MKKQKVLHVLCTDRFSGAENVACQIISAFGQDNGYEMVYCSPDGPIRTALEERGVAFAPLRCMSAGELRRVMWEQQPDIVHAHDMRAGLLCALTCGKRRLISHIHKNDPLVQRVSPKALLYLFAAVRAKHIFWVSGAAKDGYVFRRLVASKSSVLYNVIDTQRVCAAADAAKRHDAYDVVFLGRLTEPKDPLRLVEVLRRVAAAAPSVRAALVGTGDMESAVRSRICEYGLENQVHCLGFMENPHGILRGAKLMLMTSKWEGLPMCALEAMALGVPIVSTPTDGMRELILQGETGFLSNADEELAGMCLQLITDETMQKAMSASSRARAQRLMDLAQYHERIRREYTGKS